MAARSPPPSRSWRPRCRQDPQILTGPAAGLIAVTTGTRAGKPVISWHHDQDAITAASRLDGLFPEAGMTVLKRRPARGGRLARWAWIAVALAPVEWVQSLLSGIVSLSLSMGARPASGER